MASGAGGWLQRPLPLPIVTARAFPVRAIKLPAGLEPRNGSLNLAFEVLTELRVLQLDRCITRRRDKKALIGAGSKAVGFKQFVHSARLGHGSQRAAYVRKPELKAGVA